MRSSTTSKSSRRLPVSVVFAVAVFASVSMSGCGGVIRHPLPSKLAEEATLDDISGVRAWGNDFSPLLQADLVESIKQVRQINPTGLVGPNGYVNILAISGGGSNGAFGAGVLSGWTEAGDRPPFKLVTGISTGALIAPFAFVGPEYDNVLKKFYTSINAPDIYTERPFISLLAGTDSLADTSPLARLLASCVDEKLLQDVAKAHNEGRRLYIGTTNLDAGRLVIWNMGAIAASGKPQALDLFRKVMRASASIPVMFPPVYMKVKAQGKTYDEMHVDGGATTQVFFYGFTLDLPAAAREAGVEMTAPIRIYILRNAQLKKEWVDVKPRLLPIAGRSVSDLMFTQGIGDLYRIYTIAKQDGIDYKLATIPEDFEYKSKKSFDRGDMTRLFDTGFDMARSGYPWQSLPPGLKERPPLTTMTTMPSQQSQSQSQ